MESLKRVRRTLIMCALVLACCSMALAAEDVLTNLGVVRMAKAGLSDDVIINTINRAGNVMFDASVDGLLQLKHNGVSDAVLVAVSNRAAVGQADVTRQPQKSSLSAAAPASPAEQGSTASVAVVPPGNLAAQEFPNAEIYIKAPGQAKAQPVKGSLVVDPGLRQVRFVTNGMAQFAAGYGQIRSIVYERAAKPRIGLGVLVAWPLIFTKSKSHFLTFQYTAASGAGDFAIVRLDKTNYQIALATLEAETGVHIERSEEH